MNCLIIAAGYGSRLRALSESKPLTEICGVPLIERVIASAHEGGATRFAVVTGHQAERVETFLAGLARRTGIPISAVRTPDFSRPNGHSVATGADHIGGDFLLLMSDHLVAPAMIRSAIARRGEVRGVILSVDRRLDHPLIDLDDATKVETGPGGAIRNIGKSIADYDAVDTGVFMATPALAAALRQVAEAGAAGSLSEGVQWLAERGMAHTLDIGDEWWLDVDDPGALARAESELAVRRPDRLRRSHI